MDGTDQPILHDRIPPDQVERAAQRLPGMAPVGEGGWLRRDAAFAGQMRLRDRLIAEDRAAVIAETEGCRPALAELVETILTELTADPGYRIGEAAIRRPDGAEIPRDPDDPLGTLGRLVQEDLCLLEKRGEEHVMTAAVLCFPAGWTLAEKIGRPLTGIHRPVAPYDDDVAARVQRLFDGVRPGRPIWRANLHRWDDPDLHQPLPEARSGRHGAPDSPWLRSERQTVLRLPRTGAVLFAIHTSVARAPG